MTSTLTITQARLQLLNLPAMLAKDKEVKSVTVTKHGKPVLAIVDWDLFESVMETLEIMGSPQLLMDLRRGLAEASAGKTSAWGKARKRLGL